VKCPVLFLVLFIIYPAVVAVGMWESHAAFERDFPKPLREATFFVAFRGGVISTANRFCFLPVCNCFAFAERTAAAACSGAPLAS
jgi:hypothetical protein